MKGVASTVASPQTSQRAEKPCQGEQKTQDQLYAGSIFSVSSSEFLTVHFDPASAVMKCFRFKNKRT